MTQAKSQAGFSLIELLLVCVIVGIIAAVAVPAYQKATKAAENASAVQMLRVIYSTEATYYSQHGRFGRLEEIHPALNGQGVLVDDKIVRGKHTYTMAPATDDSLKQAFTIHAVRNISDNLLDMYDLDASGYIEQVF